MSGLVYSIPVPPWIKKFFIKNDFKEFFFSDVLEGDVLFDYLVSSSEFTFNKLDNQQIVNFISKFRNELVIDALDWFFFELPKYLVENYSSSDFEFRD